MKSLRTIAFPLFLGAFMACGGSQDKGMAAPPKQPVPPATAETPAAAAPWPKAEQGRFAVLVTNVGRKDRVGDAANSIVNGLKALNEQVFGASPAGMQAPMKSFEVLTMPETVGWSEQPVLRTLEDDDELARDVLTKTGASLFIDVGEMERGKERVMYVHLAGRLEMDGRGRYPLAQHLEISPSSMPNIVPIMQLAALVEAGKFDSQAGRFLVPKLEPMVQKVDSLFASHTELKKAGLFNAGGALWILGNAQFECALHKGDPAYLQKAETTFKMLAGGHALPPGMSPRDDAWTALLFANRGQVQFAMGLPGAAGVAYELALRYISRQSAPLQWAVTQTNRGHSLAKSGERPGEAAHLESARKAFQEALSVLTRDRYPMAWAATQRNIGTTLASLGRSKNDAKPLEEAVQAYRQTLLEHTRERLPFEWATIQNDLGTVLHDLGTRESGTTRLEEAAQAYDNALLEFNRDKTPGEWLFTQSNRGDNLRKLGERKKDVGLLCSALQSHLETLQFAIKVNAADYIEQFRLRVQLDLQTIDPSAPTQKPACTPPITDESWSVFQSSLPK